MKKKNYYFVLINFLLFTYLSSCSTKGGANLSSDCIVINLDSIEKQKEIRISSAFSDIETIILELNEDNLIGEVDKTTIVNDFIIISDTKRSKKMFVFKKNGMFLHSIGKQGMGPGEYTDISDFTIDPDNNFIYILDGNQQCVLKYDLSDGRYIDKIIIENQDNRALHLQYYKGRLFADIRSFSESNKNNLLKEIDVSSGRVIKNWLNVNDQNCGVTLGFSSGVGPFYFGQGSSPKFVGVFMSTIFFIENGNISPYLKLVSDNLITEDYLVSKFKTKDWVQIALNPDFYSIEKIFNIRLYAESENLIHFKYEESGGIQYTALYNKLNRQAKIGFTKNDLLFDKFGEYNISNNFAAYDSNGFYDVISGDDLSSLISQIEKGYLSKKIDKYEQLLKLTEDSNPVIFYYKCK